MTLHTKPSSPAVSNLTADVVVYGGTPGGIAAAIAAARAGRSVLMVEPTHHVGGLSTSGLNTAESEHMLKWTIGGLALEFYTRVGRRYGLDHPEFYFESGLAEDLYLEMLKKAGVRIHYGANLVNVEKEGGRICEIQLEDGARIQGRVFVDASYEGDLMAMAGCSHSIGRESRTEFGEEAAGIRFDREPRRAGTVDAMGDLLPGLQGWVNDFQEGDAHPGTMNYNFRLTVAQDPELRRPFPKPERYDRAAFQVLANWFQDTVDRNRPVVLTDVLDFYRRRNGKFEMNNKQSAIFSLGYFGGQLDWPSADVETRKRIYRDHLEYTLGLLHFLATDSAVPENVRTEMSEWGLHRDEFTDNGNLPYQLYVREARRMRGETVVAQQDVETERRKEDSIGISSHFIDSHHVQRLAVSETEFLNEGRIWRMGYAYQIPYRALVPKRNEVDNLLVPVAASYTHVAFCTLRLESVWMITGHAAGLAAAMACGADRAVQDLDVPTLQNALREQKQVVDFLSGEPEKCEHLNGPPEF